MFERKGNTEVFLIGKGIVIWLDNGIEYISREFDDILGAGTFAHARRLL